jgi:hypothetical protein
MRTLANFSIALLHSALALFRGREEQAIVALALRQQLAVYAQHRSRPRLSAVDRAFWVALSRFWPCWREHLVLVRPETVIRWHRQGFKRYWRSMSCAFSIFVCTEIAEFFGYSFSILLRTFRRICRETAPPKSATEINASRDA